MSVPSTVGTALMISDGVCILVLVTLPAPRGNGHCDPCYLKRATGVPDCGVTRLPVAELDLPTPTRTSVTHALGPSTPAAPVVLHTMSFVLAPAEIEDCISVLRYFF